MSGLVQLIRYIGLPIALDYSTLEILSPLFLSGCIVTSIGILAIQELSLSNFPIILST